MKTAISVQSTTARPRTPRTPKWSAVVITILGLYAYFHVRGEQPLSITRNASPFNLRDTLLSVPSPEYARNWSAYYTSETHIAGQGWNQAQWTRARWIELGIENTTISSHDTQLPLPTDSQRLALSENDRVVYEASLKDDPASVGFVPAYFGFSANANVSGSYVFCNFGSVEDFEALSRANVSVKGKIGIMKLGNASPYLKEKGLSIFRATSVANAEKAGMIGVALYTDPQNDGPITEANGYKPYPEGLARPLEAIERGGFGNAESYNAGDVPKVPCIPMSATDAIRLLSVLNGHGPSAKELGDRWQGSGLEYYGVKYNVGPSPQGFSLNLISHADILDSQIHNVIGTIPGKVTDEVVIVGNHRDGWGPGAGDPGSGSVALNEVVRSFGVALKQGWRPERTIIFASFEGEEFAQIGSLLWITKNLEWLKTSVAAYLNVVVAASGSHFHAKGSPLLYAAVYSATHLVQSPDQSLVGQTVRDVWNKDISPAGSGDANRFITIPCISTADFGFSQALGGPAFPYHTGYDSFEWMDQVGDPGWKYHVTSAKILSLMTAHLTESAVLQMSVTDYAGAFHKWLDGIESSNYSSSSDVNLTVLTEAVQRLDKAARRFDDYADALKTHHCTWWKFLQRCKLDADVSATNKVYMSFERKFHYSKGLDGNPGHHHVLFSPSAWHNVTPAMPGLVWSLRDGHVENAKRWRDIIAEKINDAAQLLEEHLQAVEKG